MGLASARAWHAVRNLLGEVGVSGPLVLLWPRGMRFGVSVARGRPCWSVAISMPWVLVARGGCRLLLADCVGHAAPLAKVSVMGLIFVRNREPFLGSFYGPFFGPCKKGTYCRSRVSLTFFSGQKVTPKTVSRTGAICRLTLEQNLDSVRDEGNLGQPFFLAWAPLRAASSGDPTAPYRVAFCLQAVSACEKGEHWFQALGRSGGGRRGDKQNGCCSCSYVAICV